MKITEVIHIEAVKPSNTTTSSLSKIKTINPKIISYQQKFHSGRGTFSGSVYDLSEISKIEDVESLVRQANKKKIGLMFKEGYGFSGKNEKTLHYINLRLAQVAKATSIPTLELLKRIGSSLIRTSNAFLVKVRNEKASGGRVRVTGNNKTLKPVAGYFPAPPETMFVSMHPDTGKIEKYRQKMPDGEYRDFKPEDVVHFTIDKREGFLWGTPLLIPVADDIRALRQIEENIELLLYQHIFPLFHWTVGTDDQPAGFTEEGERELEVARDWWRLMPAEGMLITDARHKIEALGAEGRALRAEGYLTHFRRRVLGGLGISEIDVGISDSANRSTARTLSRALVDSVKDIQDSLEVQWDAWVTTELLEESTFGDEAVSTDNMVSLNFAEIDVENKMEKETHALEMFKGNALTYDELRVEVGKDPIEIPEDPHDQDMSKYPKWARTHWKLFEEPQSLINAIDEPWSVAAQAAVEANTLSLTKPQQAAASQETQQARKAEMENKARMSPSKKDNFVRSTFKDLENDIVLSFDKEARLYTKKEHLLAIMRVWASDMANKFSSLAHSQLIRGFSDGFGSLHHNGAYDISLSVARTEIEARISSLLERLVVATSALISKRLERLSENDILSSGKVLSIQEIRAAFDSTRYRTDFMWKSELQKSYLYGRLLALKTTGQYLVKYSVQEDCCEKCKSVSSKEIDIRSIGIDETLPHHPGCKCLYEVVERESEGK